MKEPFSAGALLVAAAAAGLAAKGVFVKLLYSRGLSFELVGCLRGIIALPFYWIFALVQPHSATLRRSTWAAAGRAAVAGIICYYAGGLLNLAALKFIDVSLERLVLFTYPTAVVLLSAVLRRAAPSRSVLLALAGTYFGITLAVLGDTEDQIKGNLLGAALVLASALSIGAYILVAERMVRIIGSTAFTLWSTTAAALAWLVHLLLLAPTNLPSALSSDAVAWLAMLVIFSTVLPALAMVSGIQRIGAVTC